MVEKTKLVTWRPYGLSSSLAEQQGQGSPVGSASPAPAAPQGSAHSHQPQPCAGQWRPGMTYSVHAKQQKSDRLFYLTSEKKKKKTHERPGQRASYV